MKKTRILVGETYLLGGDAVVVIEELLDRSRATPRRTGRFLVERALRDGVGTSVVDGRALVPLAGSVHPLAPIDGRSLARTLARLGAAALAHCKTAEEHRVAHALAACQDLSSQALRAISEALRLERTFRRPP